jgi:hypothetical protein
LDDLDTGDALYIYTTRGAFHSPTRDRGRVIGRAIADEAVHELDEPFTLGERVFPVGCAITIESLAPQREGVELAPLRQRLGGLPTAVGAYQMALRQPLVRLAPKDSHVLDKVLANVVGSLDAAVESYRR